MKKSVWILMHLVLVSSLPIYSQDVAPVVEPVFSHEQVLLATGLSSVPFIGYSLLRGAESFAQDPPFTDSSVGQSFWAAAVPIVEPLPLFAISPGRAGLWMLGGLATFSTAEVSKMLAVPESLQHTLFLMNWKYGMYTTYETYKEFRLRAKDSDYRNKRFASFEEITLAPFSLESYNNPVSLVTVPLFIVGEAVSKFVTSGTSTSILTTGRTYVDQTELNPWVGVGVSVADAALVAIQNSYEEAYWRGYVYEELKYNLKGDWFWSSVATNTLFALWHIPNQGLNWSIAGVFASGALCTWAYELGGVPAAGAAHGLVNAMSGLVDFYLYGGQARKLADGSRKESSNAPALAVGTIGPLSVRFSY